MVNVSFQWKNTSKNFVTHFDHCTVPQCCINILVHSVFRWKLIQWFLFKGTWCEIFKWRFSSERTRLNMLFIPTPPVKAEFNAMLRMLINARNAVKCCAMQRNADQCCAILSNVEQCWSTLRNAKQCWIMLPKPKREQRKERGSDGYGRVATRRQKNCAFYRFLKLPQAEARQLKISWTVKVLMTLTELSKNFSLKS